MSLSIWRDEKAIVRWRTLGAHHDVQHQGRFEVFEDYHLRVAEITLDTQAPAGAQLPEQRFDVTETGSATFVTFSEFVPAATHAAAAATVAADPVLAAPGTPGLIDQEMFESIYNPGKQLLLASWRDLTAAAARIPKPMPAGTLRHRGARVIRDYGMFDRREAPQYFPAVTARSETEG